MFVHSKYAQADLEFIIMIYFSGRKKLRKMLRAYIHIYVRVSVYTRSQYSRIKIIS